MSLNWGTISNYAPGQTVINDWYFVFGTKACALTYDFSLPHKNSWGVQDIFACLHISRTVLKLWVNNNQVLKNVFHSEALRKYLWATFLAPNDRDKASLGSYCVNYVLVSAETGISIHLNVKNDYLKPMKRISCTPQDILKNRHPKCYHFKSKVSTGKRIPALYFYPRVQHWTPCTFT